MVSSIKPLMYPKHQNALKALRDLSYSINNAAPKMIAPNTGPSVFLAPAELELVEAGFPEVVAPAVVAPLTSIVLV